MDSQTHLAHPQVVDTVKIPAGLKPGKYVLGWRWDCEVNARNSPRVSSFHAICLDPADL